MAPCRISAVRCVLHAAGYRGIDGDRSDGRFGQRDRLAVWTRHRSSVSPAGYVSIIRGTPLLVQLFVIYYGLPDLGITLGPLTSAYIALSLDAGAYLSETFRGAILSVHKGQVEAAYSLQLSPWQTMRRIVLPQAARVAIPPMGNTFIGMLKQTSLVSVITVTELVRAAQLLIAQYYVVMPFYLAVAVMYWVLSQLFSAILRRVEGGLAVAY